MNDTHLCFADTRAFESGNAIRGAVLVTDLATEPAEFRCTSPVRPTTLQKTLWGGRLAGHIAAQLVGKPLVEALSKAPALIIVRKPEFLELRPHVRVPLILLLRQEELGKASNLALENGDDDVLDSRSGKFEAAVLKVHFEHPDDLKAAKDLLSPIFEKHNLLEPFERIGTALEVIQQQETAKPAK